MTMPRTIRALALVSLTFSVMLAIYSLSTLTSYAAVFAVFAQVLRTTGTALGLATAVVAAVASAQARRWRLFSAFLWLAALTPYSPYLISWVFSVIPALQPSSDAVGMQAFLLSYSVPSAATALLVLATESRTRISRSAPGTTGDEVDGLEVTPLKA